MDVEQAFASDKALYFWNKLDLNQSLGEVGKVQVHSPVPVLMLRAA
jgi:hypothetical protein